MAKLDESTVYVPRDSAKRKGDTCRSGSRLEARELERVESETLSKRADYHHRTFRDTGALYTVSMMNGEFDSSVEHARHLASIVAELLKVAEEFAAHRVRAPYLYDGSSMSDEFLTKAEV